MKSRSSGALKGSIVGSLLGSGSIVKSTVNNNNTYRYDCEHPSYSLIDLKRNIISQAFCNKDIPISTRSITKTNNSIHTLRKTLYRVRQAGVYFEKIYDLLYKNNKKCLTVSTLRSLTIEGLAIWVMDSWYIHKYCFVINTDKYDSFSIKQISQYFSETFNVKTKQIKHTNWRKKTTTRLSFDIKGTQKIISSIYKYILPEFYYKLDVGLKTSKSYYINTTPKYRLIYKYISEHIPSDLILDEDII